MAGQKTLRGKGQRAEPKAGRSVCSRGDLTAQGMASRRNLRGEGQHAKLKAGRRVLCREALTARGMVGRRILPGKAAMRHAERRGAQ